MFDKIKAFLKKIAPPWGGPGWDGIRDEYDLSELLQRQAYKAENDEDAPDVIGPMDDVEFYKLIDPQGCRIEIYKDKKKEWRWRLLAKNNKIIACAGEGYKRRAAMRKSLDMVREKISFCPVEEV